MEKEVKEISHYIEDQESGDVKCFVRVCSKQVEIKYNSYMMAIPQEHVLWFIKNIISASNELNLIQGETP